MSTQNGFGRVPLRYLGSKARLADGIAEVINETDPPDTVVDLFAGVGHLAARFANTAPVFACDASPAAGAVLRWRLASESAADAKVAMTVENLFEERLAALRESYEAPLASAQAFQASPSRSAWQRTEDSFQRPPGKLRERDPGSVITSYFANAYFGVEQAVEFDALRTALEAQLTSGALTTSAYLSGLVGLMCAATHLTNSPGHFAQYFEVTERNATSVAQTWSRPVWDQWELEMARMERAGSDAWRSRNKICLGDSLRFEEFREGRTVMYADPPYTEAQYSRFYHLLDTMVLYDSPACEYRGRYRDLRFHSPFCTRGSVEGAFEDLAKLAISNDAVLYLTYPTNGLFHSVGGSFTGLADQLGGTAKTVRTFGVVHAAPGRSQSQRQEVAEELWRISA